MPYTRDEVIAEITSFYEFLVGLYLPEEALKRPPSGGWTEITADRLAFLEKDDVAIDLLRHLPYIRRDIDLNPYQIYENCACNDYVGEYFEKWALQYQDRDSIEPLDNADAEITPLPPHVVTLGRAEPDDNGWFILCDTKEGKMLLVDFIMDITVEKDVKEFFEMLKKEYRTLKTIPKSPHQVVIHRRKSNERLNRIRDLYLEHGWPSEDFRKEVCLAEIAKLE